MSLTMAASTTTPSLLRLGACEVDLVGGQVLGGEGLTTREHRLLAFLAARPLEEVSRETLLSEVWGYASSTETRAVDATVMRLRRKIEADPRNPVHLTTVWGSG